MQDLCNLYEAHIAQMEQSFDAERAGVQKQIATEKQAMEQRIAEVKKEAEQESEIKVREIQQKLQKYEANNDVYINMMMEAKKSSNEIVSRARAEVSQMLEEGKELSLIHI